jgi:hypothetical protein
MSRSHQVAALALGAALVVSLLGCGGGATPTPVPTPVPTTAPTAELTPEPTSTPAAVGDVFLARVLAARTGVLAISGTLTSGTVAVPISGTLKIAGSDSQSTMTLEVPGDTQTTESIHVGTAEWNRSSGGPWVANPEPADRSKSLSAFLRTLTTLEDRGSEMRDGRQLHRLVPPPSVSVSPDALGFTDPGVLDATVAVTFWSEDDGTPAAWSFALTWTQVDGAASVPASLALDLDLSGLGRPATVEAPADAWERFTSTSLGYSMAHPAGWTVSEGDGRDVYKVDGTPYVTVAPQGLPGHTLDKFRSELIAANQQDLKAKPETDEAIVLDGQPGRLLTYHFTNADGVDVYLVDAIAMNGDTGWEIYFTQRAGSEKEDTPVFRAMLSTFAFTK